jgi:hypothetical protein
MEMEEEIKRIDMKEFREKGFLQEVNRKFFHPLGLALEVIIDEEGTVKLGGIWDYREDPEGLLYEDHVINIDKARHVEELRLSKVRARRKRGDCTEDGIQLVRD